MIDGSPTTLHKQLPLSSAEKVKSTLEKLGLTCTLEPCWELVEKEPEVEMYRCPACGHIQAPAESDLDVCEQCGVIGEKYKGVLAKRQLIEAERRKHDIRQQYEERLAQERHERETQLEEEKAIRKRFGWEKRPKTRSVLTGAAIGLSLLGVAALAFILQDRQSEPVPSPAQPANASMDPGMASGATAEGATQAFSEQDAAAEQLAMQLHEEAQAQAKRGDSAAAQQAFDKALEVANRIEDPGSRETLVGAVAQSQGSLGQLPQALQTSATIEDPQLRARTLTSIAADRAEAGDSAGSQAALSRLIDGAARAGPGDTVETAEIFQLIAEYCIKTGDYAQALEITQKLPDPYRRAVGLAKIAEAQIAMQETRGAQETLKSISNVVGQIQDDPSQTEILSTLGKLYSGLNDHDSAAKAFGMALDTADKIAGLSNRAGALGTIAKDYFLAGDKVSAERIFQRATELASVAIGDAGGDRALHKIARDRTSLKDFSGAIATADKIQAAYWRAVALKDIARTQMSAGEAIAAKQTFARALQASTQIDDLEQRSEVLTDITDAQLMAAVTPSSPSRQTPVAP